MVNQSFVETVRQCLPELSHSERLLADLLLDFPGELASYSASELAKMSGVSNATVTRFIKRLGYGSYEEARQQVRLDRESGSALYQGKRALDSNGELAAQQNQAIVNIENTFAKLSQNEINAAALAVVKARKTLLVGSRVGRIFADYLSFQLFQIIPSAYLAPSHGEALAETLAGLNKTDLVILFRLRRPTKRFDNLVQVIHRTGAQILFISDEAIERRSDVTWHIQCQTAALGPLFNHVAVMSVCHLLVSRVIHHSAGSARQRMREIEQLHSALEDV